MSPAGEDEGRGGGGSPRRRHNRVLVAVDPSTLGLAALEAPAAIAAALGAELVGLFVERQELIDLAGFPDVRAFSPGRADHFAIDIEGMNRALRAEAARAERLIVELGLRHRVRARLEVARGDVVAEVIAASEGCDVVVVGRGARPPRDLGRTVRAILSGVACAVLVLPDGGGPVRRVALIDDGEGAVRARAADIARGLRLPFVAVAATDVLGIAALDARAGTLFVTARDTGYAGPSLDARLALLGRPVLVLE